VVKRSEADITADTAPYLLPHTSCSPSTSIMGLHQNGSTSTSIMDPHAPAVELTDVSHYVAKPVDAKLSAAKPPSINSGKMLQEQDPIERLPSPTTQADAKLEQWNAPRGNLWRTLAAFWSFVVMGANDAAYGALIPYVS
jgi:hypothetical protein